MAEARKCDRCGKCFDPLEQGYFQMVRFSNPLYQTSKDIREHVFSRYLVEGASPERKIDLCPECTGQFTLFMEGSPLAIEKNDFDKADVPEDTETNGFYKDYLINEAQKILLKRLKGIGEFFQMDK